MQESEYPPSMAAWLRSVVRPTLCKPAIQGGMKRYLEYSKLRSLLRIESDKSDRKRLVVRSLQTQRLFATTISRYTYHSSNETKSKTLYSGLPAGGLSRRGVIYNKPSLSLEHQYTDGSRLAWTLIPPTASEVDCQGDE